MPSALIIKKKAVEKIIAMYAFGINYYKKAEINLKYIFQKFYQNIYFSRVAIKQI
jgi:hypothetical protein